jgi:phage-related holin
MNMDITHMQMYWLIKLDSIIGLLAFVVACIFIASIPIFIFISELPSSERSAYYGIVRKLISIILIGVSVLVLIPTTKQMAAIMIVPKIANSEKVQTIGNKVYDLAVEWMNELKPNKKEGAK